MEGQGNNKVAKLPLDEIYTGNELKNLVKGRVGGYGYRNFVHKILWHVNDNSTKVKRVVTLSGLRGVGKTVGILQTIQEIDDYDNCLYISISEMDCVQLCEILDRYYKSKKYIFIDEVGRVRDIVSNSGILYDKYCCNRNFVLVSGTDSLAISCAKGAGLYHRAILLNVTHVPYSDALQTMKQSFDDYLLYGGMYVENRIASMDSLVEYVDTAVVDNIQNTLTKNEGITRYLGLYNVSKECIRAVVFQMLFHIIFDGKYNKKFTFLNKSISRYDISNTVYTDWHDLQDILLDSFGVKRVDVSRDTALQVLDCMERIGVVVKAENMIGYRDFNYYVVNPSIGYQISKEIDRVLSSKVRRVNDNIKGTKGYLMESIVASHLYSYCNVRGYEMHYYRSNNTEEVDFVISNCSDRYVYIEVKYTDVIDDAVMKAVWINRVEEGNEDVIDRYIIYRGRTTTFQGFADKSSMYDTKRFTVEDMENRNMGIKLINIVDFVTDMNKYLNIPVDYETHC